MRAVTIVFMVVAPDLSGEHRADPVLWAKCLHRRFGSASSVWMTRMVKPLRQLIVGGA